MTPVSTAIRQAMTKRGMRVIDVARAMRVKLPTVYAWANGEHRPKVHHAVALADLLDWPSIATLAREAWTSPCLECGKLRVHGSNAGRYCGRRCQNTANSRLHRDIRGKVGVRAQRRLKVYDDTIDEMCRRWCEPAGLCRDASCPIQANGLSPLPLMSKGRRVA